MSQSDSAPEIGPRRWQFGLGDFLLSVAVAAVYLAAYVAIFRGTSGSEDVPLAAFAVVVVVGTAVGVIIPNPGMKRRAGRVVARLRGRRPQGSWFVWTCLVPFAAILLVPLCKLWPDSASFVRLLLVLFTTQSASFAVWNVWRRSLAICEHGIVTNGAAFSPWHRLRAVGHRFDSDGELTVGRGLWRVVAVVPTEDRGLVETLLKEKLGHRTPNLRKSGMER